MIFEAGPAVWNDVSDNTFSISNITRRRAFHHEVASLLSVHGEFVSTDSGVFVVVSISSFRLGGLVQTEMLHCASWEPEEERNKRLALFPRQQVLVLSWYRSLICKSVSIDCVSFYDLRDCTFYALSKECGKRLSFVTSVCPHGTKSPYTGRIFMKVKYFLKICREKYRLG